MSQVQEYWLPGYRLSRHIVLGNIQYLLGPTASARPYSYQGRDGYLIVGPPLTREQIEDLANLSREYERQATARMSNTNSHHTNGNSSPDSHTSEPFINELIPVGPHRDRERDRERDRDRRRARNDSRDSRSRRYR
ncbi:hypothetical protein FQN54_007188 [Arachnomyces sp. PD_36]|nr:hypothetical protein FQN54_007188 [Arachnomyces sp. PD_36]